MSALPLEEYPLLTNAMSIALRGSLYPTASDILRRLAGDERMGAVWRTFVRLGLDDKVFISLMKEVCALHSMSDPAQDWAKRFENFSKENEALREATALLLAYFRRSDSASPFQLTRKSRSDYRSQRQRLVSSLEFAAHHLWEVDVGSTVHSMSRLTRSQKRSDPCLAFYTLLPGALIELTGQPLYEATAIMAEVIYDRDTLSAAQVRAACERENKRRFIVKGRRTVSA